MSPSVLKSARRRLLVAIMVAGALSLVTTAARSTPAAPTTTIELLAPYDQSARATLLRVLAEFTARTGIRVQYTLCCEGSLPDLQGRIAAGTPPDVAVVFRPLELPKLARAGDLLPLSSLGLSSSHMRRNYGLGLLGGATVGGRLYAVPLKANSKSLIWYKPDSFRRYGFAVPKTWRQLLAITRGYRGKGLVPWAVGCGPGPADSWTLTDWFENIYLRTAGPRRYERLFAGRRPFNDSSVVHAIRLMQEIINNRYLLGGVRGALATSWIDALANVFGRDAKAQMYMEGGFTGQVVLGQLNPSLRPGRTINSTSWPTIDPRFRNETVGGADFVVALNNTPGVRKLLLYLSSATAGKIWAASGKVTGTWAISANRLVPRTAYANTLVANEAREVANARTLEFDGSDELPDSLNETWAAALQNIIARPRTLRQTLADFQRDAAQVFRSGKPISD